MKSLYLTLLSAAAVVSACSKNEAGSGSQEAAITNVNKLFSIITDSCVDNAVLTPEGKELTSPFGTPRGELGIEVATDSQVSALKSLSIGALVPSHEFAPDEFVHSAKFEVQSAQIAKAEKLRGHRVDYVATMKPGQFVAISTEGNTEKYELVSFRLSLRDNSDAYVTFDYRTLDSRLPIKSEFGYKGCATGLKNRALLDRLAADRT